MIQLTIAFFSWRKESFRLEVYIGYLRELPEGERIGGSLQAQDSVRGYGVLTICLKILYNTNRFFAVGTAMHCNFAFYEEKIVVAFFS